MIEKQIDSSKVSVLLPCYKSADLLRSDVWRIAYSMFRNTLPRKEVILYDNGGNDGVLQEIQKWMPNLVKVIGDGENIGLNAALNACAKEATGWYYYLPHTDMIPDYDALAKLVAHAKHLPPGSFLFCSRSIERTKGHTPFHIIKDLGGLEELKQDNYKTELWEALHNASHKLTVVTGYRMPFFLDRHLWKKMNGVDENLFSYATDNDLFLSAYDVGVRRFWMINGSMVYHLQGQSNAQQTVDRDSDKPYQYLREKWAKKGYNTAQHIDHLEQSLIPWNLHVS